MGLCQERSRCYLRSLFLWYTYCTSGYRRHRALHISSVFLSSWGEAVNNLKNLTKVWNCVWHSLSTVAHPSFWKFYAFLTTNPNMQSQCLLHPLSLSQQCTGGWQAVTHIEAASLEPLSFIDLELFRGTSGLAVMPHQRWTSLPGHKL